MSLPVELSIQIPNFSAQDPGGWDALIDAAVAADLAGINRVVFSDHVVFGENLDNYGDPKRGGTAGGKQPTGPDGHWLEPLTVLAMLSGITSQVRLGTNILLAALRRPVVLAKTASTLDVLSKGRFDMGVGVGWQAEEYEAAGLDWAERGWLLDHSLEVCQKLWTETVADYSSDSLAFEAIHQMPKPVQAGGVPIWVSGTVNPRSMKRLARFGSGWIPWGPDAADVAGGIQRMRQALEEHDRDGAEIGVVGGLGAVMMDGVVDVDGTVALVPDLVAAGVTDLRLRVPLPAGRDAAVDVLAPIVEQFRQSVD